MSAPEVFQVRDGDGWEVYVTNPAGGWWLLGDVGGTAVVDTLPDKAEVMAVQAEPSSPVGMKVTAQRNRDAMVGFSRSGEFHILRTAGSLLDAEADRLIANERVEGGDRRG